MASRHGRSVWWRWMPIVACVIAVALVATLIAYSHGYPQQRIPLNNAGVWVTSNDYRASARMNMVSGSPDMVLSPPGAVSNEVGLDVFQDGDTVMSRVIDAGILVPIDPVSGVNLDKQEVAVRPDAGVAEGGGSTNWVTVATVDKSDGGVRAVRFPVDTIATLAGLDMSLEPLATLPKSTLAAIGDGMDVAVGEDGTVYAVSASGDLVTIPAKGAGFGQPVTSSLNRTFSSVRISVVGSKPVVVDPVGCTVVIPGGNSVSLDKECQAAVQWPTSEAKSVMVATSQGILRIPMDSGDPVSMVAPQKTGGAPARPAVLDGWVLGAWAGDPGMLARVRTTGTDPSTWEITPQESSPDASLIEPTFRENRGRVLLNDMATGRVYDIDLKQSVLDWQEIKPDVEKPEDPTDCAHADASALPVANDDVQGARPGRTTAVYVLDNDTGSCNEALVVTSVTQPDKGSVMIAPDGQSVLVRMPEAAENVSFEYSVSDSKGNRDDATVSIQVRDAADNHPPIQAIYTRQADYTVPTYPVISGGMVAIPVTGPWRDPDGDPVTVMSAKAGDQTLPVTGQGLIHYAAGRVDSDETVDVTYLVSDGQAASAEGHARVIVQAFNATQGVGPVAKPDVVRARVGVPVTFFPLANDVPGSDPLHPNARLTLGGSVNSIIDVEVSTNTVSGSVTATPKQAGTYPLKYTAMYGSAIFATGDIRLEVTDGGDDSPVAMPDQVTVRGKVPVTVDPLANDFDPRGNVLTIVAVESSDPDQLSVAAVQGRWMRIEAKTLDMAPKYQVVTYTMTNGLGAFVTGDVTVTQLPAVDPDRAIVNDDYATVRAGDQITIPVLDNDASESGAPLIVTDNVSGLTPGELTVMDGAGVTAADKVGRAVVRRNQVVFMAPPPEAIETPTTVTIRYSASVSGQSADDGVVTVTINPVTEEGNRSPVPISVEARGVAGETLTIPIQIYGIDPDGDSGQVIGLDSAPKFGRVTKVAPTSITYEVFPSQEATGTDSFDYIVADKWGATGVATVRVGLAPPGQTQPPVAVEDSVTASPGASVEIHPMANDLVPVGDYSAALAPLDVFGQMPDGVSIRLDKDGKPTPIIDAPAPASADDPALTFPYALTGSGGQGPSAAITIRSVDGYNNPPRVYDHVAEVSSDQLTASAEVLDNAWDVDGPADELSVTAATPGATFNAGVVTVSIQERPQAVWFMVSDKAGGVSAAVMFVPGKHSDELYLTQQGDIQMAANASVTVELNDYIKSPRGESVHLVTQDRVWTAPVWLQAIAPTNTSVTLTSTDNKSGPAALAVWVSDATSTDDPEALSGLMTIRVQVGDPVPVMWCPTDTHYVTQGGDVLTLDITSLCHVWMPDRSKLSSLVYTASMSLSGVSAQGGPQVTIDPSASATPGDKATLTLGVDGYPTLSGELTIEVQAAPRPTITIPNITDVRQGSTVSTTLSMQSPLKGSQPTIISVEHLSGPDASVSFQGTHINVVPSGTAHGVITFRVVASDLTDTSRTDRQVTGEFTVTVYGVPDPPTPPQPGTALRSHAAGITFSPNADNGSPIDEYEVKWTDSIKSCGLNTSCDITGLKNGVEVQFQARAHNKAGWSEWSAPGGSVMPDEVPGAVPWCKVAPTDTSHLLSLTWGQPPVDGTAVFVYVVAWTGGPTYVTGTEVLPSPHASIFVPDNDNVYTFSIVAENKAGRSQQPVSCSGQASGKPVMGSVNVRMEPFEATDGAAALTVSWGLGSAEGPSDKVTYTVTRSGGTAGPYTWPNLSATSLPDSVPLDGGTYTYSVTATVDPGGAVHTSDPATGSLTAVGSVAPWGAGALVPKPSGANGEGTLTVTYPASHGSSSYIQVTVGNQAPITKDRLSVAGGTVDVHVTGLTNGTDTPISVITCNERSDNPCNQPATTTMNTFGPLSAPVLTEGSVTSGKACVSMTANGNGRSAAATITATTPSGGSATSPAFTGIGAISSGEWCADAAAHTTVTFTASLSDVSNNRGPVASLPIRLTTLYADPPTIGAISVWGSGRSACASVSGDGKGHQSTITLTAGSDIKTGSGTGAVSSGQLCVGVGDEGGSVQFAASITTADPSVDPTKRTVPATQVPPWIIDPAYNPQISITQSANVDPRYPNLHSLVIKTSGFPAGNMYCRFLWVGGNDNDILGYLPANTTLDTSGATWKEFMEGDITGHKDARYFKPGFGTTTMECSSGGIGTTWGPAPNP